MRTRIPDVVLQSVVFLGHKNKDKNVSLKGTGFFVAVENVFGAQTYLVTAKHIAILLGESFILRMNRKDGISHDIPIDPPRKWYFHPYESDCVDVAVMPMVPNESRFEYKPLSSDMINDSLVTQNNAGIGDTVFFPGLFSNLSEAPMNLPIMRHGNIAMLSKGRFVPSQMYGRIEAHLVEARSIGGLSGSPAFVYLGDHFFLLGLIHGHWMTGGKQANDRIITTDNVNMGIAMVVPAGKIIETINQRELIKQREEKIRKYQLTHN